MTPLIFGIRHVLGLVLSHAGLAQPEGNGKLPAGGGALAENRGTAGDAGTEIGPAMATGDRHATSNATTDASCCTLQPAMSIVRSADEWPMNGAA